MAFRSFLFTVLALFPNLAEAVTIEIDEPCADRPAYISTVNANMGSTVGSVTLEFLKDRRIPFNGSEGGFVSILNTREGDAALELIDNGDLRAYGWCFEVDGKWTDLMAGQYQLSGYEKIRWFYAYAYFQGRDWVSQCVPAHTLKNSLYCK